MTLVVGHSMSAIAIDTHSEIDTHSQATEKASYKSEIKTVYCGWLMSRAHIQELSKAEFSPLIVIQYRI